MRTLFILFGYWLLLYIYSPSMGHAHDHTSLFHSQHIAMHADTAPTAVNRPKWRNSIQTHLCTPHIIMCHGYWRRVARIQPKLNKRNCLFLSVTFGWLGCQLPSARYGRQRCGSALNFCICRFIVILSLALGDDCTMGPGRFN